MQGVGRRVPPTMPAGVCSVTLLRGVGSGRGSSLTLHRTRWVGHGSQGGVCLWAGMSQTWWTGTGVAAGPCTAAKPSLVSWLRVPRASACARCWALVPWPRWTRPRPHCPLGCGGVPRALLMVSGCSGGADEEAPVAGGCSSPPAWCPASWKASAASNAGSFP